MPFTVTKARAIDEVQAGTVVVVKGEVFQLRRGDIILAIGGERVESGADVRSVLRNAMAALSGDECEITIVLWRPPDGFAPNTHGSARDETAAVPGAPLNESYPAWKDSELINLRRLTLRLLGGTKTKTNLVKMCGALGLGKQGSPTLLKRRIEFELRKRQFKNHKWKPTEHDLDTLSESAINKLPTHSISGVVSFLQSLPHEIGA